ncbi:MAG: imidazoleglycerol-phosphate dehydratase HisB [Thermoguttaceae bacterium]
MRTATISRNTNETQISCFINIDGTGESEISTGIGFFDHMLTLWAAHSHFDLKLQANGDLHIDGHHTVEDVGIAIGQGILTAIGDKRGIRRYGHFTLPMDETLVTTAVDFCGRPAFVYRVEFGSPKIGSFDTELVREFWLGLCTASSVNLHLLLHYGTNSHHISEALFKSMARSMRMAVEFDPSQKGIPSTKGTLN